MAKELVINETHNESRVALIENGEILDFLIERASPNKYLFR
jgi:Ribonuclease G/E